MDDLFLTVQLFIINGSQPLNCMKVPPCLLRVDGVYGAIYDGVFIYVFILNSLHIRLHTVCVCVGQYVVLRKGGMAD